MADKTPYDPNYPVEISLGRPMPKDGPLAGLAGAPASKSKGKTAMSYPTTYISGGSDLSKIPKKGYALIEFNRVAAGTRTPSEGKGKEEGNVELEIHSICLPKSGGGDMASDFAQFAKKAGVDTGDGAPAEPDADDETEEA